MHNLELKCIDNELVVIDAKTDKPIGYLPYNRSFINATLKLKATVMNAIPISSQERAEQYKKEYYQPPHSDHTQKTLQLHKQDRETPHSQTAAKNDSHSAKSYNSSGESESIQKNQTKGIVTRVSALSGLISKISAIQNNPSAETEEAKPMLVRLSPQLSKSTTTQRANSSCPCCNGTGAFVRGKVTRTCFRCDGKGYMDDVDRKRYEAYLVSRSYANKTTYKDHNNKYTLR